MKDATPPSPCPSPYGATCNAYKVTWTQPNPTGVTIKVFAVTKCLAKPHCIPKAGIFIPAADLVQVGSAAASKGSLTFVVGGGQSDGDGWMKSSGGKTLFVDAVVVQASSGSGKSLLKSLLMTAWTW
jgi:hypothetical protein